MDRADFHMIRRAVQGYRLVNSGDRRKRKRGERVLKAIARGRGALGDEALVLGSVLYGLECLGEAADHAALSIWRAARRFGAAMRAAR